jgi:hypothetical protein
MKHRRFIQQTFDADDAPKISVGLTFSDKRNPILLGPSPTVLTVLTMPPIPPGTDGKSLCAFFAGAAEEQLDAVSHMCAAVITNLAAKDPGIDIPRLLERMGCVVQAKIEEIQASSEE